MMHPLVLSATSEELYFIANLDYGEGKEQHSDNKSARHRKVPLSTDPTKPEYVSSAYLCDKNNVP